MGKGIAVSEILRPLKNNEQQFYLGNKLHTLGLLIWILEQTGKADVYVSTFSTSDAFLSGFHRLRKRNLINRAVLLADIKASRKTVILKKLMKNCFDSIFLGMNHSKVVLVKNDKWSVSSLSSQNQTYGGRAESTMITTSQLAFSELLSGYNEVVESSLRVDGILKTDTGEN